MTEQYIVAVFLGADLNVDACGPFRSLERAEGVRDRINEAGDWTDHPDVDGATIIAQVVPLRSVADLVAAAGPPSDWGEVGTGAGEVAPRQLISVPTLDPGSAWATSPEVWIRSWRWMPNASTADKHGDIVGPWHLRDATRPYYSDKAVCGVYPTRRKNVSEGRPAEGRICPKCRKAADAALAGGDDHA